ncbi:hypothetical protein N7326_06210 [Corynebacterium sp. ES2794-CONJ1]|uniref:hypothetical protein n=1 Tax=unclassified Corynebacterium TaxID=2624378 RepID=UPI00216A9037|nr:MULTISPECIES: hypothetical protein [unclassified Corynebacterium]MCS4490231.1 hypothetical protein [Corynebacterium sp. ES2775-CONJ]MCS4491958.1 hypothetical protein [Corynebacterium sp. ES2715-CONJ3]MCS4532062.1 hypothetical protein [Corynebacterium sp. ES2730-CONJ]MCU9519464.1 hypothetical protein [Corynebacterium sp. ES2794-CONJ1]
MNKSEASVKAYEGFTEAITQWTGLSNEGLIGGLIDIFLALAKHLGRVSDLLSFLK